jgi:hypothetical protein
LGIVTHKEVNSELHNVLEPIDHGVLAFPQFWNLEFGLPIKNAKKRCSAIGSDSKSKIEINLK